MLLVSALLLAVAAMALAVDPQESDASSSGLCGDDLTWTLDDGNLSITGSGEMYDYEAKKAPWGTKIKSLNIGDSVTSIGNHAFYVCKSLESVDIPESVTSIRYNAFRGCTSLASVDIEGSVTSIGESAFRGCTSLDSVTIPDSVRRIGISAFNGCTSLASADIGGSVTFIGESAFRGCTSLESVTIPDSVKTIGDYAFRGCTSLASADIGDSVTGPGFFAFQECTSLESVTIGKSVTEINSSTFSDCTSLTSISVDPKNMNYMYKDGFLLNKSGNTLIMALNMSEANIPGSVKTINSRAFNGCASLESVVIPRSVTSIHAYAFWNCASLASFTVDPANETYSSVDGLFLSKTGETLFFVPSLSRVVVPSSVTAIEHYAFQYPESIECLEIPYSVTSFSNYVTEWTFHDEEGQEISSSVDNLSGYSFEKTGEVLKRTGYYENCIISDGLKYEVGSIDAEYATLAGYSETISSLAVPETVERSGHEYKVASIAPKAFYGCSELRSVDLGSVSEVGSKAFARCRMLASVDAGDSLESIGPYAFYDCVRLRNIDLSGSVDNLRTIGSYGFFRCNLDSLSVPSDIERIGKCGLPRSLAHEDGNPLEMTAEALAGYTYSNVDGVLVRQAGPVIGHEYSYEGLVYRVVKTLPAELELVGYEGSPESVSVPEAVEFDGFTFEVPSIGYAAFRGCRTLTSVDMPGVESVCSKAFANCTRLSSVTMGDGLRTVGAYAFYRCLSLESFDAPGSLEIVGSYAFYRCSSLEEIELGESLTRIGAYSFASCPAVSEISIPQALSRIGDDAFGDLAFLDAGGNGLPKTAEALRGHVFAGSDGVLQATS